VFSRFIEAHGRKGDILLGISTSGKSPNVLLAAKAAKQLGVHVIALTGKHDCSLAEVADIHIATPGGLWADRVQELHIKVIHSLIDLIERRVFL
jgi:D-sedoheptulose 7-phosphate isomerase